MVGMTIVDWAIIVLLLVLVPVGYHRGLLVAGLGLGGFALGAAIGARVAPLVLEEGSASPYAPAIALLGGLLIGGLVAALLEGLAFSLRERLPPGGALASADSIGGAVAFAGLGLAIVEQVMRKHRGSVRLESVERGTSVRLEVPRAEASPAFRRHS